MDLMWLTIQKSMFPASPRRSRRNPGKTELTVVGGLSTEDVLQEALLDLLRSEPDGDVNWEGLGVTIARRRAADALRRATKNRHRPDGSEIGLISLDIEDAEGERLFDPADDNGIEEDEIVDLVLRIDRLLAVRQVGQEILSQRDWGIVVRVSKGETNVTIANDLPISPQAVGQIYSKSLRKIKARLRSDGKYRRLYEPEGGNPDD